MERSAGPRIYVPLGVPDATTQPTYAVLEFVGFSAPPANPLPPSPLLCLPAPSPNGVVPAGATPSAATALIPAHSSNATAAPPPSTSILTLNPQFFPLAIPAPPFGSHSHFGSAQIPLFLPSPTHHHHHTLLNSTHQREVVNLDSPPASPSSSRAPSSASATSASRDSKEKTSSATTTNSILTIANPNNSNNIHNHIHSQSSFISNNNGNFAMMKTSNSNNNSSFSASKPPASTTTASLSPRPLVSFPASSSSSDAAGVGTQTKISVSHTERETIVHTHSSNFRDVVRQLTGASSDDQDLLPVTLPARLANRINNSNASNSNNGSNTTTTNNINSNNTGTSVTLTDLSVSSNNATNNSTVKTASELGLRKAPLKLHERRKSNMKNLEKLTTVFHSEVSSFNPSPVTPLASDFEKFCNATTPTSQSNSALNSPIALINKAKPSLDVVNPALNPGNHSPIALMNKPKSNCSSNVIPPNAMASASIQEPNFFLQRPEKPSPTLLNLFPESPVCSPRDR